MFSVAPATEADAGEAKALRSLSKQAGEEYSVLTIVDEQALTAEQPLTVEQHVRLYFWDIPVLARVAECESHFRHTGADGSILRGDINRSDVGVMQINEYYHGKTARAFGLDLHRLDDNMAYARYLYEKEGTQPWSSSSACWKESAHIAKQ